MNLTLAPLFAGLTLLAAPSPSLNPMAPLQEESPKVTKAQLDALQVRVSSLTNELSLLQDERSALKSQLSDSESRNFYFQDLQKSADQKLAVAQKELSIAKDELLALKDQVTTLENRSSRMESKLATYIFKPEHFDAHEIVQVAGQSFGQDVQYFRTSDPYSDQHRNRFTPLHSANMVIVTDFPERLESAVKHLKELDATMADRPNVLDAPEKDVAAPAPQMMIRSWLVAPTEVNGDNLQPLPSELSNGLQFLVPEYTYGGLAHSLTRTPENSSIRWTTNPPQLGSGQDFVRSWEMSMDVGGYDAEAKTLEIRSFTNYLVYLSNIDERLETSMTVREGEYAVVGSVRGGESYVVLSFQTL